MWTQTETDRWTMEDTDRHLLVKDGTRYVELHGIVIHVYEGPETVVIPAYPLGDPADFDNPVITWKATEIRDDLADLDDDAVWAALTEVASA